MSAAQDLESGSPGIINEAVIFLSRLALRPIMLRDLKAAGVNDVKVVENAMDCVAYLVHHPQALLIIDWEHGEDVVLKVLKNAQGEFGVDTRPIYMIAFQGSQKLVSIAHEYNVLQIHSGEISKAQIEKNLKELLQFSLLSPLCRETFIKVAKARKENRRKEAMELLGRLQEAEPDNARAAVEYGYCLCEEDGLGPAINHLVGVTNRFPFEMRAHHLLARCYMKLGEWERAENCLEQAHLIHPKNVDRLCDYGRCLMNTNQLEKAMGKFREALALDDDCREAKIGHVQCEMLLNHMNGALKVLNQMQRAQERASVFNGAAIIAIRQKNFRQGLSLYKTAVAFVSDEAPVLSRVFFNMGLGLAKWGKISLAVRAFERSAQLDPSFKKASHNAKLIASLHKKGVDVYSLRYGNAVLESEGKLEAREGRLDVKPEAKADGRIEADEIMDVSGDDDFLNSLVPEV